MLVKSLVGLVALTALGLGAINALAFRREAQAEKRWPPTGQILIVDGQEIHAQVMGNGPDVVLIHGSSGNLRDMTFRLAPELADQYRVITFDRPGLGYSDPIDPNGASITQQADILQKAALQLGADKPIVVGQSYGGAVALAWAVDHPDALSALVTVSGASHPWPTPLSRFYRVTSSWLGRVFVVPALTAFVSDQRIKGEVESVFAPQNAPQGYADHFGPGLTLRRSSLRANALQRANLLGEINQLHGKYPQISVPVEVLHGTADDTVSLKLHAERMSQDIPGAHLSLLPGIGHMPQHVATPDVAAAVHRAAARAGLR